MKREFANPIAIALNERGAKTAARMGLRVEIGKPGQIIDDHWSRDSALVLVMALPIVVRLLAKRELSKDCDPVIVAVDESGRFVIPVLGGHKGANRLAAELASRNGGTAVITTSSEVAGVAAVDGSSGFAAEGDIAKLIESMLEGRTPIIQNEIDWPAPIHLRNGIGPSLVIISDRKSCLNECRPPTVQLIPPSLVVGVGCSSEASAEEVSLLIESVCLENDLERRAIAELATIDTRADHPALVGQQLPIVSFSSAQLASIEVPTPSAEVQSFVDTPSVCEAAALLASGSPTLLVTKTKSRVATIAIARRRPKGTLKLVGLGPGTPMMRTPAAVEAIVNSEVIIGYKPYVEQCKELLSPRQLIIRSPIGSEDDRARSALEHASQGRSVAIVCSGDPEVFAMASITFEMLESLCSEMGISSPEEFVELAVIPGITAGLGGGALLGAPLGNDHAYLSLSDLLTPWDTIEKRIHAFGEADVVILIYNPQSKSRTWQLPKAIEILSSYRPRNTPVAVVRNVGRDAETKEIFSLESFDAKKVDMSSLVIVGSSTTRQVGSYLFTPRGYEI